MQLNPTQQAILETVHTLRNAGVETVTVARIWCCLPEVSFDDIYAAIEASNLEIQVDSYGVITCCLERTV